jgi:20S proteasome alpha/beta subunit
MTLIAGFRCNDGFVICADAQETVGDFRVAVQKIEPKTLGNFEMVIGGSGNNGDVIDAAIYFLEETVEDAPEKSVADLKIIIEKRLKEFLSSEVVTKTVSEQDRLPQFLIALRSRITSEIGAWRSALDKLIPIKDHALIGCAKDVYKHVVKERYSTSISITRAILLGIDVFRLAKETSNYIGGPTSVVIVRPAGITNGNPSRIKEEEESVALFAQMINAVLLSSADASIGSEQFKTDFRELEATIFALREEREHVPLDAYIAVAVQSGRLHAAVGNPIAIAIDGERMKSKHGKSKKHK